MISEFKRLEYEHLGSVAERAAWLLTQEASTSIDIDGKTLEPCLRVSYADVMLPQKHFGSKEEALRDAETWLRDKANARNEPRYE